MTGRARGRPARVEFPMVGVLGRRGRFPVVEPLFTRAGQGRQGTGGPGGTVVEVARGGGSDGDLVLVGAGKKGARVVRRLGRPTVARDVVEALMLDRGLRRSFPRRVEEEAAALEPAADDERVDLRELSTFTIDPDDARDFDDAISAQHQDDGIIRVWVHIADVCAHVRPGGAIEAEAVRRGTSTYVPGAVEPMLPEALSNGACSLRPGEDKLAVTVEMDMAGTDVRRVRFLRTLIRSDRRLTYGEVDQILAGTMRAEEPWGRPLAAAREVAAALAAKRRDAGALEVNSKEPSFVFADDGRVTAVHHEEQTESHELIEHLMILANEQVAGYLSDRKLPTLFRVHEKPDPVKVEHMVDQLASLDVPTPAVPDPMSPQQAADVAAEASRLAAAEARRGDRGATAFGSLVLRSLKQAYYSPRNLGHAGLASSRYCHFTSPIRRYPDLVAHRALLAGLGLDGAAPRASDMEEAGIESSAREREAMKIEREADDVCLAFLLEDELGRAGGGDPPVFDGEVVGLVAKGAFVRFAEEGFEGFLGVRSLRGWYELNELGTALESDARSVRMGDPVRVMVERVDAPRGRVELAPAA
ncbi:MAG TPA: RNB domain-containing ribonuclease [Thermoleophilaceae bacterium]|nr:RNB domain-containing ribonuclease [Thermoleophilaceae bacterium]